MSGLLGQMAASSRVRCDRAKATVSLDALRRRAQDHTPPPLVLDGFDLIAEVKLRAPSAGALVGEGVDRQALVLRQARTYAQAGAAAISVLTEPDRFDGDLAYLEAVAAAVDVPAMRKDFLVDPYQVWEAAAAGAGGVLLITRMVDDATLDAQLDAAAEAGLFALVEAFDADDLHRTAQALQRRRREGTVLVGVNTRDLVTLAVDGHRLASLAPHLPEGVPAVAESGMGGPDDTAAAAGLGYRLALVGSALMGSGDPLALAASMIAAGRTAEAP